MFAVHSVALNGLSLEPRVLVLDTAMTLDSWKVFWNSHIEAAVACWSSGCWTCGNRPRRVRVAKCPIAAASWSKADYLGK